jgi:hypothetical protein
MFEMEMWSKDFFWDCCCRKRNICSMYYDDDDDDDSRKVQSLETTNSLNWIFQVCDNG